jgi:hypothetical protein
VDWDVLTQETGQLGKCFLSRYGVPAADQPPDFAGVLNVSGRARYGNYAKVLQI